MTRYQIIDGKRVQLTSKEEAERDADIKAYVESLPSKRMVSNPDVKSLHSAF